MTKKFILFLCVIIHISTIIFLQCVEKYERPYTYTKYIIIAKEANPKPSGCGCDKGTNTTVKNITTGLILIWCGNYGSIGDTIINREYLK